MSTRHRAFVSYHHHNDQDFKDYFQRKFGDQFEILIPGSINIGDINPNLRTETIRQKIRDEYLRDTTVTVVLVGTQTWQRKHVDWEISSSIRDTTYNPRSGLIGVLLPSYLRQHPNGWSRYTIPPRLYDNVEGGYAKLYNWTEEPNSVAAWIHDAFLRRKTDIPDNSFPHFINNRSGERWYP